MMRSLFWGVGLDATRGRSVLVHPAGITVVTHTAITWPLLDGFLRMQVSCDSECPG